MGSDTTEAISVKIDVKKIEVRLVSGYGAQESDRQAKIHEINQIERIKLLWDQIKKFKWNPFCQVLETKPCNSCGQQFRTVSRFDNQEKENHNENLKNQ